MGINAADFLNKAETLAPWIEKLAQVTGHRIVRTLASVLRRATENPETKQQLAEWLRWLPVFSAVPGQAIDTGPDLPAAYADISTAMEELRAACHSCEDVGELGS